MITKDLMMNANTKIEVGFITAFVWIVAIVLKHFYPDLSSDLGQLTLACSSVLTGLGIYHISTKDDDLPPPPPAVVTEVTPGPKVSV
jgi:hypothetical protein